MVDEKELQEKMLLYRLLESRLDASVKQRQLISAKLEEIASTASSLEEIGANQEDILFKLGGEAYAHGKVIDKNKILVEVGAGIILEKPLEDAKKILNERKGEMENVLKEIQESILKITTGINQLAPEINELIQKSQTENSAG